MSRSLRNVNFEELLQKDLTELFTEAVRSNPGIKHEEAMKKAAQTVLENNPFVPPKGCPVHYLPNELLAHIFQAGLNMDDDDDEWDDVDDESDSESQWETESEDSDEAPMLIDSGTKMAIDNDEAEEHAEDEDGNDENDKERKEDAARRLPFQMLVSHVCKRWREVALETPTLWTGLSFAPGSSIESAKAWIERSKGQPLDIDIDCSGPIEFNKLRENENDSSDDDLAGNDATSRIVEAITQVLGPPEPPEDMPGMSKEMVIAFLDVVIPHVDRWRGFRATADHYDRIFLVIERLAQCQSASMLEALDLSQHDDQQDFETFPEPEFKQAFLLFNGNAPNLKSVRFWGVHVDWDASLSFIKGIRGLELAYHTNDVRPSFETFANMLAGSPDLEMLSLATSGPMRPTAESPWPERHKTVEIPSLKELELIQQEQEYIMELLPLLSIPNVISLIIDFDSEDFTNFAMLLAQPPSGRRSGSLLSGLQQLKIDSLPCNTNAKETMLEQLVNLKMINLNCSDEEELEFYDLLKKLKPNTESRKTEAPGPSVLYCPNLTSVYTTGICGKMMKTLVEARRQGGVPLKRIGMSEDDDVEEEDQEWLKDNVEEVEFFEPDSDFDELITVGEFSDLDEDSMDSDADLDN